MSTQFEKYAKFLKDILSAVERRFEPWPTWLINCNDAFYFSDGKSDEERTRALNLLLDCPFGPSPMVENEKKKT